MRIAIVVALLIAGVLGYFALNAKNQQAETAPATGVANRLKSAAESVIVRQVETPECAKLLNNIKSKTSATVQKITPSGHEVLLEHAATKSTISLDCSTPAKMTMTFISKDSAPTDAWYSVIGNASDILVGRDASAIIAEARKCLTIAKKDKTTSAEEDEAGMDIDCSLPEDGETGFLVAVMPFDPAAAPPPPRKADPKPPVSPKAKPVGKHHKQ